MHQVGARYLQSDLFHLVYELYVCFIMYRKNIEQIRERPHLESQPGSPRKSLNGRTKKRLSIELSVEKYAPNLHFYFAYTFWNCPEYMSRIYSPPATDVNLLSVTQSSELDRLAQINVFLYKSIQTHTGVFEDLI